MIRRLRTLALGVLALAAVGRAADVPAVPEGPVVQLPPMIVSEPSKGPPWRYVRTATAEYLSRCSEGVTRDFVAGDMRQLQLLRRLVPEEFIARMDVPALVVIERMESKPSRDTVMQDMLAAAREAQEAVRGPGTGALPDRIALSRVDIFPNLRIEDRDGFGLFAYLDNNRFDGDKMAITPSYVRLLLERRVPELPAWLVEGIVGLFEHTSLVVDPITVRPLRWMSREDTRALQRDPELPRALLPMNELLAPDALRGADNDHERRRRVWLAQVALFFRWGIDPRHGMRAAFWKFAAVASERAVTEADFEACFGFGFAEMRDRLSDYLPIAVKEPFRLDPGKLERTPPVEVRRATDEQVNRLLGEWQRLEVLHVKARHPEFAAQYLLQARRTLQRAHGAGDRDPQLLASLGLLEADAGNDAAARGYLEAAVGGSVVRPRAYAELARLRLAELTRDQPARRDFSAAEIARVVEPLHSGRAQAPALMEIYGLLADAWLRTAEPPSGADFGALAQGAELFRRQAWLAFRIALLQGMHGRRPQAMALLEKVHPFADDPTQRRIDELRKTLAVRP